MLLGHFECLLDNLFDLFRHQQHLEKYWYHFNVHLLCETSMNSSYKFDVFMIYMKNNIMLVYKQILE